MTFVDTSALYAILDRTDPSHAAARQIWTRIANDQATLLTTNYIVVETMALTQRRLGLDAVRRLHDDVLPVIELMWIDRNDHGAAIDALLTANRRDLSLVDCTSFHAMRKLGIREAFAFDDDFARQGFVVLSADG